MNRTTLACMLQDAIHYLWCAQRDPRSAFQGRESVARPVAMRYAVQRYNEAAALAGAPSVKNGRNLESKINAIADAHKVVARRGETVESVLRSEFPRVEGGEGLAVPFAGRHEMVIGGEGYTVPLVTSVHNELTEMLGLILDHAKGDTYAGNRAFDRADSLTRRLTCFSDFSAMISEYFRFGYRPSIYADTPAHAALALAYDYAMFSRGHSVRSYPGSGCALPLTGAILT